MGAYFDISKKGNSFPVSRFGDGWLTLAQRVNGLRDECGICDGLVYYVIWVIFVSQLEVM
jgi:hypothetical protein